MVTYLDAEIDESDNCSQTKASHKIKLLQMNSVLLVCAAR